MSCISLDVEKTKYYASSTVFYRYSSINSKGKFDLEELGELSVNRNVANSYIDTDKSFVVIIPKLYWFLFTMFVITCFIYKFIPWLRRVVGKIWEILKMVFKSLWIIK